MSSNFSQGPIGWQPPEFPGTDGVSTLYINSLRVDSAVSISLEDEEDSVFIESISGGGVLHKTIQATSSPKRMGQKTISIVIQKDELSVSRTVLQARAKGPGISIWPGLVESVSWTGDGVLTTFILPHALPYDLPGMTKTARPPFANVDGTELTIVDSSPGPGEILVPSDGSFSVTTGDPVADGAILTLTYQPVYSGSIVSFSNESSSYNTGTYEIEILAFTDSRRF